MARPKYTITAADVNHAYFYLSTRLTMHRIDFRGEIELLDNSPEREFRELREEKRKDNRARGLNAWCEKYLDSTEWTKLKAAIRKRRERLERYSELKTVTISSKAFELLVKLSARDKVTYSDALEHYLLIAWKGQGRGKR